MSTIDKSGWLRLRQIALVVEEMAPAEQALIDVLGIEVAHRDPGIIRYGLENILLPIGNQLLEVVAPVQENTAGGRYLERRGGDGGYMVITQAEAQAPHRARVDALGIRLVSDSDSGSFRNMQLHPKDTGGSFFEIDEVYGQPGAHDVDGPWPPSGDDWQRAKRLDRVTAVTAAEVQCDDPARTAARWSAISGIPLTQQAGHPSLPLDDANVRFVACTDGRPEGLGAIDIACADKAAVLSAAEARGAVTGPNQVYLCGMRINLS